jgi:hypothetical protein
MTITIDLPSEVENALLEKASANGKDIQNYIEDLLRKQALRPTLDELLAPVRRDFEESGMGEEDLNDFFDDLRDKVWQEKQNADK